VRSLPGAVGAACASVTRTSSRLVVASFGDCGGVGVGLHQIDRPRTRARRISLFIGHTGLIDEPVVEVATLRGVQALTSSRAAWIRAFRIRECATMSRRYNKLTHDPATNFVDDIAPMSNPHEPDAVAWHGSVASCFDDRYSASKPFRERLDVWRAAIDRHMRDGDTVLDLGCGTGIISALAATRANRVIGLDGSSEMIAIARRRARELGLQNVEFAQHRLENLGTLSDCQADLIVCSSVFEYLENPGAFLNECTRLLRPQGILLISTQNGRSWYRILERIAFGTLRIPRYRAFVHVAEHKGEMMLRLVGAGFEVTEAIPFGSPPFLGKLFRKHALELFSDTMLLFIATTQKQ
jgi:ubiquinone/menaquinone biosynthesis C-methylase UbiE